jgi:hypothetical protein
MSQLDLQKIPDTPIDESDEPDDLSLREVHDLELQAIKTHIEGVRQDISERKTYANRIFRLLCFWLAGMAGLLVFQGALSGFGWFNLSEKVLLAAIGGTTINVIGIFLVVANYLFPKQSYGLPSVLASSRRGRPNGN